jgi:carbon storage regulator CsrA
MLVLTRKKSESIAIGGLNDTRPLVTVTVLEICGGRVRLGFKGDPSVFIHRAELWARIQTDAEPDKRKEGIPTAQGVPPAADV